MDIIYLPLVEMALHVIFQTAGFPAGTDSSEVSGLTGSLCDQAFPSQRSRTPAISRAATKEVQKAGRQQDKNSIMLIASKLCIM